MIWRNITKRFAVYRYTTKKGVTNVTPFRGAYGTRTRDPMRDRHVF